MRSDVKRTRTYSQFFDRLHIDVNANVRVHGSPCLFDNRCNVLEVRLLESTLDDSGSAFARGVLKLSRDDGGGDELGSVDDLFDSGHTEGNGHGGNSSEMEAREDGVM